MKKFLAGSLFLMLLIAGCSSDDDDGGGTITPTTPVVTVVAGGSSPDMTNPNSTVWSSVTGKSIEVSGSNTPKLAPGKAASIPSSITVQAMTNNDSLFMRFQWVDNDHSVWRDYFEITSVGPPIGITKSGELIELEDQLIVMFEAGGELGWDIWNWRSLTTDGGGVAEGMHMADGAALPTPDNNAGSTPSHQNWLGGFPSLPAYVHKDTSDFDGYILPEIPDSLLLYSDTNAFGNNINQTTGWSVGDRIPGYRMETDYYGPAKETARGSRFDIRAGHAYNDGTSTYTVVMARKLNTGFTDDMNLTGADQVNMKIGVYDQQIVFGTGSNNRGFTGNITLDF